MIATSADYSGRTVDLEIFQSEYDAAASKQLTLTMTAGDISRRVAGIQKLAQRYMLTFFTPKGSVPFRPGFGSIFMPAVSGGLMQSRTAVVQYFSFADADVAQQLRVQDQSPAGLATPADEQYASSALLDYGVDTGSSTLYIKMQLTSQAGAAYTFILPIK
jgi:hypothetical protein